MNRLQYEWKFLVYETEFAYFRGAGKFFFAYRIRISACFTLTDDSFIFFSCIPDKDIRVFYLDI